MQLNEFELNIVSDRLTNLGLDYDPLIEDLLDHFCCMIEMEMECGTSFKDALKIAFEKINVREIQKIEEDTIYLLTEKTKKMKKIVGTTGIIASIIILLAILFKKLHLMGAGVLLVIGMAILSLILFPLMAKIDLEGNKTKMQKWTLIAGYISATILSTAVLFKIMYWPYASFLLRTGFILLVFVFIPLFTFKNYRIAENKIFALSKSFLIITGIILFWSLNEQL